MQIEYIKENGVTIAVVTGEEKVVTDAASALELAMSAKYETGADRLAIDKRVIAEDFFILSTGMAGEILQKFINYHVKAAIWGDYARYTSKPLKDFIYESNKGRDFFFVETKEEALRKLAEAK
ncbi:MAG: DUF4180 domain-containing protein [Oscillospiraceae bacterium]|nr:DUF4180 domain-containing protein [Oscillospiraceae bacterium]